MLSTKTRKLVLGLFLLLVVDIIWVLSSELTKVGDEIPALRPTCL